MPAFDFYGEWKPIRNWLNNFWVEQIFLQSIENLKKCWGKSVLDGLNDPLPSPWISLLTLKWGLIYGNSDRHSSKVFGPKEFGQAYNRILGLPTQLNLLGQGDSLSLWRFVRASFVNQFYYQNKIWFYGLSVMETILMDIGIVYETESNFLSCVGLELEEFLSLQVLICGGLSIPNAKPHLKVENFKKFSSTYSLESMKKFLDFSSLDFREVPFFLRDSHEKIKDPEYEYGMFSPLYLKPFFKIGENYFPYHQTLIQYYVEYGVYDILRQNDRSGFSGKFGYGFEKYVRIPLEYSGENIFHENEIKQILHEDSVSDYAIIFGQDGLVVEAKSAEMYPLLHQNPTIENLKASLEQSVIKGY